MTEKRHIVEDFKTYFNIDIENIQGYAIMVDGDNTASRATSWFADIHVSTQ